MRAMELLLPAPLGPAGLPDPGIEPTSLNASCIGRWVLYHSYHLGSAPRAHAQQKKPWDKKTMHHN